MEVIELDQKVLFEKIDACGDNFANNIGLYVALQHYHMDVLSPKSPYIPDNIKEFLSKAQKQKLFSSPVVNQSLLLFPIFLFASLRVPTFLSIVITIFFGVVFPFALYKLHMNTDWSKKQVEQLMQTSFIFVENNKIYANFPELNALEHQIMETQTIKKQAENTSKQIDHLASTIKEKLILLGQSTNDASLLNLETHKLTQEQLIAEAEKTLDVTKKKVQECKKLREEIIQWAELDWIKRQANQLSGVEQREQAWKKMAELELQAHGIQQEMLGITGQLGRALADWQSNHLTKLS